MVKIELKKELESLKNNDVENSEMFLNEVKQLMEGTVLEERDLLKSMGLGSNIIKSENKTKDLNEFKEMEKTYEGEIYTIDQIKHLAFKYNLRFLNSRQFKGTVAPELGSILVGFKKKHLLSDYDMRDNFFILAPESMFKLNKRPIDPLIFYKATNKNSDKTVYKLVHKWGEDFSITRRISGILNKSEASIMFKRMFASLSILALLYYSLKHIALSFDFVFFGTHSPGFLGVIVIASCFLIAAYNIYNLIEYSADNYYKYTSQYRWNNQFDN